MLRLSFWSCVIQVAKSDWLTTAPLVSDMLPCQIPQSSAQRTVKEPVCSVVTYATLSSPGLASALTPSWYAQNEWRMSVEVMWNTTFAFTGSIRSVSYTHLRAHETRHELVCRLLLEKKKE